MSTLPPNSKLCSGQWTGVICSRREQCARYVEIANAEPTAPVFYSLCPDRDHYWPHFVKIDATP